MFFKKIALCVITMGIAAGFIMQPVSADAKTERVKRDAVYHIEETDAKDAAETETATQAPAESKSPAATATPVATNTSVADSSDNLQMGTVTAGKNVPPAKTTTKVSVKKSSKKVKKYKKSELRLMASIINCEAGGESFQGQVAVGIVVMNRVKSKAFPSTIKKVIYQKGQFSPVRNGMLRKKLKQYDAGKTNSAQWKSCIKAAKKALNGESTIKVKGKTKSMKGVRFFSVSLSGAKFRLGGHRFK